MIAGMPYGLKDERERETRRVTGKNSSIYME
jgi:hypothetical protein